MLDVSLPNLQHSSHCVRLFILQILKYFPLKHAIVVHNYLDLRDDLDEEYASLDNNTSSLSTSSTRLSVNLFETFYKLETLTTSFQNDSNFGCNLTQ